VTATLQLVRGGFGVELRRGTFHVLVEGNNVASIEWKQTIEVPIEPDHQTLQITAGRYTSRGHRVDTAVVGHVASVGEKEETSFRTGGDQQCPQR
jgi:hypothetical protein